MGSDPAQYYKSVHWNKAGPRARVLAGPCSDTMSDRVYPLRIEVALGGQQLRGCGIDLR